MDPSMLLAFLVRDHSDWVQWKKLIQEVDGTQFLHVEAHELNQEPPIGGREDAVSEVESFDDELEAGEFERV